MKIITICNYPDNKNTNILCHWWLNQVLTNSELEVEIWYEKSINNPLLENIKTNRVRYIQKSRIDPKPLLISCNLDNKANHNIGFKLYNLCQEKDPFIFIDMDAIILKNIKTLLEASREQPVIMVNHQEIEGHTKHLPEPIKHNFLNSGLQIVSDPRLMDFDEIIKYQRMRRGYIVPGYDQALIFNYFRNINYDYTHPKVGYEWNNAAGSNMPLDMVCINHYWLDFKPWLINCPLWKRYNAV